MKILSLDLSTKSSGWAIFEDEQLIDYGCITSASTDLLKRIEIMTQGIYEILNSHPDINTIIAEEVRPEGGYGVGNQKTHKALMYLQASLEFLIYKYFKKKITTEYIYPSSWRAACNIKNGRGIHRTTLKEADIEFVKNTFNIEVNDDIADAIGIGFAHNKKIETEINWE